MVGFVYIVFGVISAAYFNTYIHPIEMRRGAHEIERTDRKAAQQWTYEWNQACGKVVRAGYFRLKAIVGNALFHGMTDDDRSRLFGELVRAAPTAVYP